MQDWSLRVAARRRARAPFSMVLSTSGNNCRASAGMASAVGNSNAASRVGQPLTQRAVPLARTLLDIAAQFPAHSPKAGNLNDCSTLTAASFWELQVCKLAADSKSSCEGALCAWRRYNACLRRPSPGPPLIPRPLMPAPPPHQWQCFLNGSPRGGAHTAADPKRPRLRGGGAGA